MALVHEHLQLAASLALQGQQEVLKDFGDIPDDAHREAIVTVSGLFNKLAQDVYRILGRLERDDDSDDDPESD